MFGQCTNARGPQLRPSLISPCLFLSEHGTHALQAYRTLLHRFSPFPLIFSMERNKTLFLSYHSFNGVSVFFKSRKLQRGQSKFYEENFMKKYYEKVLSNLYFSKGLLSVSFLKVMAKSFSMLRVPERKFLLLGL